MASIRHFVVLMLENRSFDMMLGDPFWPHASPVDHLRGDETNVANGTPYRVSHQIPAGNQPDCVPSPDPGELFTDINTQLFLNPALRAAGAPPTMEGFAQNYAAQPGAPNPQGVMHYYTEARLPVMRLLAQQFGFSDQWFASAPCQTWPNRFFAHTGTCLGIPDNDKFFAAGQVPFKAPSIFRALETANQSWAVYYHDFPQSLLLNDILDLVPDRFRNFAQRFEADAAAGDLQLYSFIEPRYFADPAEGPPNDQHPPYHIGFGEQLIAQVYNALRASPAWEQTLLLVTYDEHGGCYDHVPPPAALPPDGRTTPDGFAFDAYGVRVPALIISPWIQQGSVPQPLGGGEYPFDHTSIIATVCELAGVAPLGLRAAHAPSLLKFLGLESASNLGPERITVSPPPANVATLTRMATDAPNSLQQAFNYAAQLLAIDGVSVGLEALDKAETVAEAAARAIASAEKFLHKL